MYLLTEQIKTNISNPCIHSDPQPQRIEWMNVCIVEWMERNKIY